MRLIACAFLLVLTACDADERYAALEEKYLTEGKLRQDRAATDAPVNAQSLSQSFEAIAYRQEINGQIGLSRPSELRRWVGPVTWSLAGDGVRDDDRAAVADIIASISSATGLAFEEAEDGDLSILVIGPELRGQLAAQLSLAKRPRRAKFVRDWARTRAFPCAGYSVADPDEPGRLISAAALVKSELPPRLRHACLNEEIAQAMGLPNDWPGARPSIFNDDQEFAALTDHDLLLLRILYDTRLTPGSTAEEDMPTVRRIAAELAPASKSLPTTR